MYGSILFVLSCTSENTYSPFLISLIFLLLLPLLPSLISFIFFWTVIFSDYFNLLYTWFLSVTYVKDPLSILYKWSINYIGQIHITNFVQADSCEYIKPFFIDIYHLCYTNSVIRLLSLLWQLFYQHVPKGLHLKYKLHFVQISIQRNKDNTTQINTKCIFCEAANSKRFSQMAEQMDLKRLTIFVAYFPLVCLF